MFTEAAQLLSDLADTTRIRILMILADGELNVSSICERLGRSQPSVSYHLSHLRYTGLVSTRRQGKSVYYSLPRDTGQSLLHIPYRGISVTIAAAQRSLVAEQALTRRGE